MMNLSILSWNVRGLRCSEKSAVAKEGVRSSKANVVMLQETTMSMVDRSLLHQVSHFSILDGVCLPSLGYQGDLGNLRFESGGSGGL